MSDKQTQTFKYEPVKTSSHSTGAGVKHVFWFENGYGASVVRFWVQDGGFLGGYSSYGGDEGLFELACIKMKSGATNVEDFEIVYEPPSMRGDVLGYLTPEQVDDILDKIKAL